ncbi:MAG: monovalent cation/H+ antiporter complex subunit F [Haloferacaceae archaeon]
MTAGGLVSTTLLATAVLLVVVSVLFVYRAAAGPTVQDRVVGVNAVGTTTVVVVALLAGALGQPGFLDVALVYAMLNFLLSLGVAKFSVERGGLT